RGHGAARPPLPRPPSPPRPLPLLRGGVRAEHEPCGPRGGPADVAAPAAGPRGRAGRLLLPRLVAGPPGRLRRRALVAGRRRRPRRALPRLPRRARPAQPHLRLRVPRLPPPPGPLLAARPRPRRLRPAHLFPLRLRPPRRLQLLLQSCRRRVPHRGAHHVRLLRAALAAAARALDAPRGGQRHRRRARGPVGSEYYMAFGWADPGRNVSMIGADVAVAGFTEEGLPFADDDFVTKYSECLLRGDGGAEDVCPDTFYDRRNGSTAGDASVNNTRLVYGHRRDGVSFVRFSRPLASPDKRYDVAVNATREMTVIWAIGLLRQPDLLRPYYLPLNHGAPAGTAYGFLTLNVSAATNGCPGPLDAEDKEDQGRIKAERQTPLVVTTGPALHYPNPPNPEKVLYINKKEAPLLKVERGVPVTFSVEAGHDVPLYIMSDAVGGNATARNMSEVIYAGNPTAEGVPATPTELVWLPDRNTPDLVYYQSLYDPKMGWKIQVVDGGLSDMYNNSVLLDDQQVTFFWTLSGDSINIAAHGEKKSGYIAIGFGGAMGNNYAYVGWVDGNDMGHVNSYWIDGKDGMSVHETHENLTYKRCLSENGMIIFEFTRPLTPSCSGRVECKNIDPSTPLKVIWAMGSQWSSGRLSVKNMHSVTSNRPIRILLLSGLAEAVEDLRPVLAVHGFMMFVAWGLLLPGGIVAARYLKHVKGDLWFQAHTYLQYSGLAVMFMGVLFAVAELRGFSFKSTHAKVGAIAFTFTCMQPVNAYLRPHQAENGEILSRNRITWEYLHTYTGRTALVAAVTALFTGLQHLGHRYGSKTIKGLTCGLVVWVVSAVLVVAYLEYMKVKRRRDGADGLMHKFVLGNTEEDDSVDLLQSDRFDSKMDSGSPGSMEVQLEPLKG
uniref:Cytochrome b561 domain-containing protein n=2 Tax=Aegilops tauschii subsp. strangulata TaxID=200361 RepID=A0A453LED6_AEGTS